MRATLAFAGLASAAGLLLFATAQAVTPDERALGLWSYHTRYPTGLQGRLSIARQGRVWRATLGGAAARASAGGPEIRLVFAGDGGAFRGTFDRGVLRGFWVRRQVIEDPLFPSGEALSYATPLRLRAAGPGRWTATVTPLEDTFTLYLKLFRDSDGEVKAAFRNPEQNSHGAAMQFTVTQAGDRLTLRPAGPATPPDSEVQATLLRGPDRIRLFWKDLKATVELARTPPEAAVRFFPRAPGAAPYVYRAPAATGDGWKVAPAGELGIDEAALARVVQRIIDVDPAGARPWMIHAIAVAYKGRLVLDETFYGYGRDEPHDTRSASKTFSSVMLGAVMREGVKLSPASRAYQVLAARGPFANPDPRKDRITLGHLMTHTAGLACDDNAEASPGNEETLEADRSRPDWTKVTLDLPMQFEPGEHYAYCSMNMNLAGAMLSQATGEWLPALFDRTLARPLQFRTYHWNLTGVGEGYLGGGVFVVPRDVLKLGQVYLDGGTWNGRRLVDAAWVKDSLSPHAHISPRTTGLTGEAFLTNYYEVDEGWAWHMIGVKSGGRVYPAYHANGAGGQLLILVPQFELAVMFTAGNYGQGLWNRERDDLVGGMIIPAIGKRPVATAGRRPGRPTTTPPP